MSGICKGHLLPIIPKETSDYTIRENKNIFITGSAGTGKTFIATALGNCACQKNLRVIYANTARLMGLLKASRASGKILRDLKREGTFIGADYPSLRRAGSKKKDIHRVRMLNNSMSTAPAIRHKLK